MKTATIAAALLLALALTGCGKEPSSTNEGGATSAKAPPEPQVDRVAEALEKAKADGKNVLVEYYDVTCNFCTQMDKEVYPDEFVKDGLTGVVYVRLERGKNAKPFEDRWGRKPTPTFAVLKPDGTPKGTQVGELLTGFIDVGGMMDLLDWAANPEGDIPGFDTGGS